MSQTHKRNRKRTKALHQLEQAARADLELVSEGRPVDAKLASRLVSAAVEFADPWLGAAPDALLPSDRTAVRREFFRRALAGPEPTATQLRSIALELMPAPGEHDGPLRRGARQPPAYGEALRAFEWRRDRSRRRRAA